MDINNLDTSMSPIVQNGDEVLYAASRGDNGMWSIHVLLPDGRDLSNFRGTAEEVMDACEAHRYAVKDTVRGTCFLEGRLEEMERTLKWGADVLGISEDEARRRGLQQIKNDIRERVNNI